MDESTGERRALAEIIGNGLVNREGHNVPVTKLVGPATVEDIERRLERADDEDETPDLDENFRITDLR